jgi:Rad3-related DNA helicase
MSYYEREKTLPKMADQIGRIADLWEGHKGFVHCNSYKIAEQIYNRLPNDVQRRTRLQDGDKREQSLDEWVADSPHKTSSYSDGGGQVFLSVAMAEGISLDDDLARWQVVAKASYPHMKDERVEYRMDDDTMGGAQWNWYSSKAAIDLQQSVGRAMRSADDWCATYILDDSAVQLINRNEHLMEDWFLEAVDCDYDASVVSPENGRTEDTGVDRKDSGELDEIADEYFG